MSGEAAVGGLSITFVILILILIAVGSPTCQRLLPPAAVLSSQSVQKISAFTLINKHKIIHK